MMNRRQGLFGAMALGLFLGTKRFFPVPQEPEGCDCNLCRCGREMMVAASAAFLKALRELHSMPRMTWITGENAGYSCTIDIPIPSPR